MNYEKYKVLNLRFLTNIFLAANEAGFIYKKYTADETVSTFASSMEPGDLFSDFKEIEAIGEKSIADIVRAYAIIAAFTLKNAEHSLPFFSYLASSGFGWGKELAHLYLTKRKSTNLHIKAENITEEMTTVATNSSSGNSIHSVVFQ